MKTAFAYLTLFFGIFAIREGQAQTDPVLPHPSATLLSTEPDDSMVLIQGGTFQMGIDAADIPRFQKLFAINSTELFLSELPRHTVTVEDFYIDKNLVTNAQFKTFVDANPKLI